LTSPLGASTLARSDPVALIQGRRGKISHFWRPDLGQIRSIVGRKTAGQGASDEALRGQIRALWQERRDRYSEERSEALASGPESIHRF